MNNLLPLLYLFILISSLGLLLFFLIKQIFQKREKENELSLLQQKLRAGSISYFEHYSLGVIYLSKKLFDQAIIQFSYALKKWDRLDTPGLANLYNTIGFTYFESNQFDLAIYYYQEAIILIPDYIVALNNLAYAYEKKKSLLDAVATYKKVLSYDEKNNIANEKIQSLTRRIKTRDDRI